MLQLTEQKPATENLSIKVGISAEPKCFTSQFTIKIETKKDQDIIVRLFDPSNRIIKMFSWRVKYCLNFTTLCGLTEFAPGKYFLDAIDTDANFLSGVELYKLSDASHQ